MEGYIERKAVHELVKHLPRYQMFNYDRTKSICGVDPDDVDFGVDKIQAADVVQVRHGRWIEMRATYKGGDGRLIATYCSECGTDMGIGKVNYCPECGAKMDGKAAEEAGRG